MDHERTRDRGGDDFDLLRRVRRGDQTAFRTLFDRHLPRVRAFITRRLPDPGLAEETVIDTFFEVWRSAAAFRGRARVSTWILGIAQFKCLAARRAQGRDKRSRMQPTRPDVLQRVADGRDAERALQSRDALAEALGAIGELPDGHREVAELAFVEGLSYEEIAGRLGVSLSAVKTRVSRTRSRLRRRFQVIPGGRS